MTERVCEVDSRQFLIRSANNIPLGHRKKTEQGREFTLKYIKNQHQIYIKTHIKVLTSLVQMAIHKSIDLLKMCLRESAPATYSSPSVALH